MKTACFILFTSLGEELYGVRRRVDPMRVMRGTDRKNRREEPAEFDVEGSGKHTLDCPSIYKRSNPSACSFIVLFNRVKASFRARITVLYFP